MIGKAPVPPGPSAGGGFSIDWRAGRVTRDGPHRDEPGLDCTISGDWTPVHHITYACDRGVYGGLVPHLDGADLNVVNVETVIGDRGRMMVKPGPSLRCGREYLDLLRDPRFHLACLANNHVKDYGEEGLLETVSSLRGAGLDTIGAAEDPRGAAEPFRLEHQGIKLAVINAAEGGLALPENGGAGVASFDLPRLSRQIRKLKEEGYLVLGIFHAGREHVPLPPPYIHRALHLLAEDGLDLIVCHHPHVVQGIEVHAGVPILYSLGNFLFARSGPKPKIGLTARCRFARRGLLSIDLIPFEIGPEHLRLLEDRCKAEFLAELHHLSDLISEPRLAEFWQAYCGLFELDDLLPRSWIGRREGRRDYARLINRIGMPANREVILSLAKQKLSGPQDMKPWVADLMARYPQTVRYRPSVVGKIGRVMRAIGRRAPVPVALLLSLPVGAAAQLTGLERVAPGVVSTDHNETFPALAPDGLALYFSRYDDGDGGADVWRIPVGEVEELQGAIDLEKPVSEEAP